MEPITLKFIDEMLKSEKHIQKNIQNRKNVFTEETTTNDIAYRLLINATFPSLKDSQQELESV